MSRFEQEVQAFMDSQKSQYETQLAEARANALAQWEAGLAELEKESARRVAETLLAYPEDEREAVASRLYAEAAQELARLRDERLTMACAMIEEPWKREQVERHLSHLREPYLSQMPAQENQPDMRHAIWRLADGRLYDIAAMRFLETGADAERIIDLGGEPTLENIKANLAYYCLPMSAEFLDEAERFALLRQERDKRIAATDYLMCADYPLDSACRLEVQAYRAALRDLPAQAGAPWDGGGQATPWPAVPANVKA